MDLFEYKKQNNSKNGKRMLAFILCIMMLCTSVDLTAIAAEVEETVTEISKKASVKLAAHIEKDITPDIEHAFGAVAISNEETWAEAGDVVEMQVYAWSDEGELQYTWYAPSGGVLANVENTLQISAIKNEEFGTYRCMVTDTAGNSKNIDFYVYQYSMIRIRQITDSIVHAYMGQEVRFAVEAVDYADKDAELTYQWYQGTELIAGATEEEYIFENTFETTYWPGIEYTCVVSNGAQQEKAYFTLYSNGKGTANVESSIQETKYCKEGSAITLNVNTTATNPKLLTYEWYQDGILIEGATGAELQCIPFTADNREKENIYYSCKVYYGNNYSGACGYPIVKIADDVVTGSDTSADIMIGEKVTLAATPKIAEGSLEQDISYRWYRLTEDGEEVEIADAEEDKLVFENICEADFGQYKVKIFWGEDKSAETVYTLYKKIYTLNQSANQAHEGMPVTFSLTLPSWAFGKDIAYQWYVHETYGEAKKAIADATGKELVITYTEAVKNAYYSCDFTIDGITYTTYQAGIGKISENEWYTNLYQNNIYNPVYYNKKTQTKVTIDPRVAKGSNVELDYQWEKYEADTWKLLNEKVSTYEVAIKDILDEGKNYYRVTITDKNGKSIVLHFALIKENTLQVEDTQIGNRVVYSYSNVLSPQITETNPGIINNDIYASLGEKAVFQIPNYISVYNKITYQWQKESQNTWENIEGVADSPYYVIPEVTKSDWGRYRCLVMDGNEEEKYEINLTQDFIWWGTESLSANTIPGNKNVSVSCGMPTTFSKRTDFSYAWFKEAGDTWIPVEESAHITGTMTNTLVFDTIETADYGNYKCKVTAGGASIERTVSIYFDGIRWKSGSTHLKLSISKDGNIDFQTNVEAPEEMVTYQWGEWIGIDEETEEFKPIKDANEAVYSTTFKVADGSKRYGCMVDVGGYTQKLYCIVSAKDKVTPFYVFAKKSDSESVHKRVVRGKNMDMGVVVYSKEDVTYQWEKCIAADPEEFEAIENATEPEYQLTLQKDEDYASYRCAVTQAESGLTQYVYYHIFEKKEEAVTPSVPSTEEKQPENGSSENDNQENKNPQNQTIAVTGITLNKISLNMKKGERETLSAAIVPTNATNQTITWSSSDAGVASVENGVVTANKKGTAVITAATVDGDKTASCTVNVLIPAEKVMLIKSKSIVKGEQCKLKATVLPKDSTDSVTWTSSNEKVVTVASDGTVKAVKTGKAKITAKAASGKKAVCTIYVVRKKVKASKVKLNREKVTVKAGKVLQLKAVLSPKKSTNGLKWTSSNKKIAEVDANGVVITKRSGKVKITVKADNGKKAVCKLTVTQDAKSVQLNKTKLTLKVKETFVLKAQMDPKDATDKLTWKSSNKKIVSVNKKGKVKALKKGKAVITVKTSSGKKATCKITVK